MRRRLAVALLSLACSRERPGEPVGNAPLEPIATREPIVAARTSASAQASPCVVPTPDTPPPKAKKAEKCPPDPGPQPTLPTGRVTFVGASGKPRVDVEIARTSAEQARGLMYRTSMPEDHGMLFSYPQERELAFWMKNTCIPLDMLFLAKDGSIVGILEEVPVLSLDSRSVDCRAAHVLELNAGYCRRHGIKAGMRVELE